MTLPTRFAVCTRSDHVGALANEYVVAGWQRRDLPIDPEPWSQRGTGVLWIAIDLPTAQLEHPLELLTRGISVLLHLNEDGGAGRAFDEGRRLADAEWFDDLNPPMTLGLDLVQIRLLAMVGRGADVGTAAGAEHLSARTAARRLANARDLLGAGSTAEAAARLALRIERLRHG